MSGQVALVTGAGRGIGRAIAMAFAREGATVVSTDIDVTAVQETAARIVEAGGSAHVKGLDVSDGEQVDLVVGWCRDTLDRLDVVVNNAGVHDAIPMLEFGLDTWQRAFAVNVHGPFAMMTAAARLMIKQDVHVLTRCRGKIINVSSGAADSPRPDFAAYGATKAALNHVSQSAAAAFAQYHIPVTVMCPTSVADGMWRDMGDKLARMTGRPAAEIVQERLDRTPGGRFETAENVAATAVFIATAIGGYLNGRRVWTSGYVDERDARAPYA